jgi:hypothetical protein
MLSLSTPEAHGVTVMGARRIRREQRREDMAESRRVNGMRKMKERARRETLLLEIVKKGKLPFTPPVMSWLSAALDKPSGRIQQADVDQFVSAKSKDREGKGSV